MFLVARRAEDILNTEDPEALARAINELAVLKQSQPTLITREDQHPFTECATFSDDIKGFLGFQSGWHFVDQPYLDQGGSLEDF